MIAVLFEAWPTPGQRDTYLSLAASLRSELAENAGLISIERFESLTEPGKILSLSIWRDEDSIAQWRANSRHRSAQSAGRRSIFADYRLRIADVVRDYGKHDRAQAPAPT